MSATEKANTLVDHLFRSSAGQMVSYLTRVLGPEHMDVAEEAVQEALLKALQRWPHAGVPDNPVAWLFQVARNAALDSVRHRGLVAEKEPQVVAELSRAYRQDTMPTDSEIRDDELRMIFLCCHPALSQAARVGLSLKTVGGFSVEEIARAFLVEPVTIAQRLVRAKRQIRESRLAFNLPGEADLAPRLDSVLEVIYLMFNEGYAAHAGEELIRTDVCAEALRLGQLVAASPLSSPKAHALVALMAFQAARFASRTDSSGELVLLEDQDRSLWDPRLIALGFQELAAGAEGDELTSYHAEAAIASVHAAARDAASTDWAAVLRLYDELAAIHPSPVVSLNRAVAVARMHGTAAALRELDSIEGTPAMKNYYLFPAVRGRLLLDAGDVESAAACFREALRRPCSEPERRFLERKLMECEGRHGQAAESDARPLIR